MDKKRISFTIPWPHLDQAWAFARKWLLPNPGTLILMVILALAIPAIASPAQSPSATSTSTISYQGRLADSGGNPLTGKYNLEFRIYDSPSGGTPLWTEMWTGGNAVDVSDGLFNVMLGSINNTLAAAIEGQDELYLGITVGTDAEMTPRIQLGSVPFSMQALSLPTGAITTTMIANGAVTQVKLGSDVSLVPPAGSITTTMLADDAVTGAKIAHQFGASNQQLLNFVPRTGITGWDYDGDPSTSWTDFDATSITSDTAVLLWIHVRYRHQVDGESFYFRRKGATETYEQYELAASSGFHWHEEDCLVEVDGDQTFQFMKRVGGSASLRFIIRGWWEPAQTP